MGNYHLSRPRSYFLPLIFLPVLTSCNEPAPLDDRQMEIDSLTSIVDSLSSELADNRLLIDSSINANSTDSVIDSLEFALMRKDVEFSALTQAQVGEFQSLKEEDENGTWAYEYRVEVYGSEIYKSVYLTKIEYFSESARRIGSTYKIDLENELGLSGESTNSLEFVKWASDIEFQLATRDSTYNLTILGPTNVKAVK